MFPGQWASWKEVKLFFAAAHKKHVSLYVTETELYAAVSTAQDMLYTMNALLSLGVSVELSMVSEVDNMCAVNNWSVSRRTRHIYAIQCFI